MATVTIKLCYGDNPLLRRTVAPGFDLAHFQKWVFDSFPLDPATATLTYTDQDGDECAINTIHDFNEAMDMSRRQGTSLRIQVQGTEITGATTTATPAPIQEPRREEKEKKKEQEEVAAVEEEPHREEEEETTEDDEEGEEVLLGGATGGLTDLAAAGLAELEEALRNPGQRGQPFVTRMARCPLVREFMGRARQEHEIFMQVGGNRIVAALTELVRATVATSLEYAAAHNNNRSTSASGGGASCCAEQAPIPQGDEGREEEEEEEVPAEGVAGKRHYGVQCDGCGVEPIVGIRYKDAIRPNYDLCQACEAKEDSWHPFFEITDPEQAPSPLLEVVCRRGRAARAHRKGGRESNVHARVTCNGCGQRPIIGNRYKCTERFDYDLCQECRQADLTGLPFLKIKSPSAAPVRIHRAARRHGGGGGGGLLAIVRAVNEAVQQAQAQPQPQPDARKEEHEVEVGEEEQQVAPPVGAAAPQVQVEEDTQAQAAVHALSSAEVTPASPALASATHEDEGGAAVGSAVGRGLGFGVRMSRPAGTYRRLVARFVEDKTIPDGTILPPKTAFSKTWIVSNRGLVDFPEGTRLVFSYGDRMDGPVDGVMVGSVRAEEEFEVTVPLVTPPQAGRVQGYWQLEAPAPAEGLAPTKFGPHLFVDITVDATLVDDQWQVVDDKVQEEAAHDEEEDEDEEEDDEPTAEELRQWSEQLRALCDMGFTDVKANVEALDKYFEEGGLDTVVDKLLTY